MYKSLKEKNTYSKEEVYMILRKYCEDSISSSLSEMRSKEKFNMPAWSEHQAYQLGFQKAFSKLLEFIPDQGA